ncbi:hypothetical protein LTSEADE_5740 [Salmonella enterica subsp. enterica serovar Adelaide str. A4-669]|uniref:Uncharacterized protein n=1 Tax=Salmonella enterica subsp. enterica serovar Adelaide str. A4-669 TaxID=913063 RepID=A0A6C8GFI1_SALET|nr:hypothetical protein LTSEADE_5740 [Salmonella enterica subsp. enterica serovar Adelaide str. A4-669]
MATQVRHPAVPRQALPAEYCSGICTPCSSHQQGQLSLFMPSSF